LLLKAKDLLVGGQLQLGRLYHEAKAEARNQAKSENHGEQGEFGKHG